jgi:YidC/Oxa1 family membrane protein insertase
MVAARAAVSPTMSPAQQKLMQYLPVAFAVFQVFFLLGLVVYYIVQSILRILQQFYITKRFYAGDESLGRQAQAASERAREMAKSDGGGGPLAQAKRDLADAKKSTKGSKSSKQADDGPEPAVRPTKRTTPPKNRPTPSAKQPASKRPSTRPSSRPASSKRHRKS